MRLTVCHRWQSAIPLASPYWEAAAGMGVWWLSPASWSDRLAIWLAGGIFRIDRRGLPVQLGSYGPPTVGSCPQPTDLAVGLKVAGDFWVFSHRAVYQAAEAWKQFDIARVYGVPLWADWFNDIPQWSGEETFYRCPSPREGFWAATNGRHIVLWHPQILGPCGRVMHDGSLEMAKGLDWDGSRSFRGEQLPVGVVINKRVEPVAGSEGWFSLGLRYENRRL